MFTDSNFYISNYLEESILLLIKLDVFLEFILCTVYFSLLGRVESTMPGFKYLSEMESEMFKELKWLQGLKDLSPTDCSYFIR